MSHRLIVASLFTVCTLASLAARPAEAALQLNWGAITGSMSPGGTVEVPLFLTGNEAELAAIDADFGPNSMPVDLTRDSGAAFVSAITLPVYYEYDAAPSLPAANLAFEALDNNFDTTPNPVLTLDGFLIATFEFTLGPEGDSSTFTVADVPTDWVVTNGFSFFLEEIAGDSLTLTVIPEPAAGVLAGLGLLLLARRRRAVTAVK